MSLMRGIRTQQALYLVIDQFVNICKTISASCLYMLLVTSTRTMCTYWYLENECILLRSTTYVHSMEIAEINMGLVLVSYADSSDVVMGRVDHKSHYATIHK